MYVPTSVGAVSVFENIPYEFVVTFPKEVHVTPQLALYCRLNVADWTGTLNWLTKIPLSVKVAPELVGLGKILA